MVDLILFVIVMTAFACFFLVLYSYIFREFIRMNLFNGIDKDTAKVFIKNLPFRQRLFMPYIKRCNPTGKQRLGLAIWLIICHCLHIIAVIAFICAVWYEFLLELLLNQRVDGSTYIMGLPLTYGALFGLVTAIIIGAIPFSAPIGLLIHRFSKNKYDLQTIKITRQANSNDGKSGSYNVFTSTKANAPVRIKENETKEFKVVKGNQTFCISQGWTPKYLVKSNDLDINVLDSIVELEVGCDNDNNLWIREREKSSDISNA